MNLGMQLETALILVIMTTLALAMLVYLVYEWVRSLVGRSLGAQMLVRPNPVELGRTVTLELRLRPRRDVKANMVIGRLRCLRDCQRQSCRHGQSHTYIETEEVARIEGLFCGSTVFTAGKHTHLKTELPVPEGPPSGSRGIVTVRWVAEAEFDVPELPDPTLEIPLVVRSPGALGPK
jgi:hypothetical protein